VLYILDCKLVLYVFGALKRLSGLGKPVFFLNAGYSYNKNRQIDNSKIKTFECLFRVAF